MKKFSTIISILLIIGIIYYSFDSLMPSNGTPLSLPETQFSTERALIPLKEISKAPHFLGSEDHERVRLYLISHLKSMGLEVESQVGYVLQDELRTLVKPKNIIARIKGSNSKKSLMLLTHYDSAKIPSFGASDAGSGVVTILESIRAYLSKGKTPKNDIIILFTDSEELGLDGAKLFTNKHPWAKDVGLALNFEARGSGGPSTMILETNQGNANLIKSFIQANPEFPVASSLMYSIYKMLPNDTDSTVLREDGDIDSFFFAFIDDHYDYHTSNDTVENLDIKTLQHQGSYLVPLLSYFADADLTTLKSNEDFVYVNFPFIKMISYPFSWILWMLIIAIGIFFIFTYYGISIRKIPGISIGKGFIAFLISLILCGVIGYFGWDFLQLMYPQYSEIQHGFTYNGHLYIAFFVFLSLAILFAVYHRFTKNEPPVALFVAPLTLWVLINGIIYFYLKGAAFFIIPVFFGLFSFWLLIRKEKPNVLLLTLLTAPALFFFSPLVQFFPVGLGLKMIVLSCIFTVLIFGLLVPIFGFYKQKKLLSILCLLLAIGFFIRSHLTSSFSEERQKPNSLVYYQDSDKETCYWITYDSVLDDWTKGYLGERPEEAIKYVSNEADSKYNTGYTYASMAPQKNISPSSITIGIDTIINTNRKVTFTIRPDRKIHQITLYTDTTHIFKELRFNGEVAALDSLGNAFGNRSHNRLLSYYITDTDSLEVSYLTQGTKSVEFTCLEYSFDLLDHPKFSIPDRHMAMMPKPFVLTDAIVVKKTFVIDSLPTTQQDTLISMAPISYE